MPALEVDASNRHSPDMARITLQDQQTVCEPAMQNDLEKPGSGSAAKTTNGTGDKSEDDHGLAKQNTEPGQARKDIGPDNGIPVPTVSRKRPAEAALPADQVVLRRPMPPLPNIGAFFGPYTQRLLAAIDRAVASGDIVRMERAQKDLDDWIIEVQRQVHEVCTKWRKIAQKLRTAARALEAQGRTSGKEMPASCTEIKEIGAGERGT